MNAPFDYPAAVVEADTAVIFCLDSDLAITYCNPAWDQFALDNGAPGLCRQGLIGTCVLEHISGSARDFYAKTYKRVLAQSKPWEHVYQCSSANVYREFRLVVIPINEGRALFVRNSLYVEHEHEMPSCKMSEAVYRDSNGLITMCSGCRRTRKNASRVELWDWVPTLLTIPPAAARHITHGICPACQKFYYPEDGS